ncbi:MAG: Co2+/Mg2+ efflux protein ApaG [Silvanigrellales bacterium]|jgi:ApaG protein|nr:Co2+/Mg2+ efflux protein ApaG [Silvanigrellales bacterium]
MYAQATNKILVEVSPVFIPERSNRDLKYYFFAYTVRIENLGNRTCQLLRRHWVIRDGHGHQDHVLGDGVVGEQPLLAPGESFTYTSACPLRTPSGSMRGTFEMIDEAKQTFKVAIPLFFLRGHERDAEQTARC